MIEQFRNDDHEGDIAYEIQGCICTPDNTRILWFADDPLCTHLEYSPEGAEFPFGFVLPKECYIELIHESFPVIRYQHASEDLKEWIVELHLEHQEEELDIWYSDNS